MLYSHMRSLAPIDDDVLSALDAHWGEVSFKRKDTITVEGNTEKYLYFVLDGVQRAFTVKNGKDATLIFSYKGSFSGVLDSFLLQEPSKYHLEALTSSKMLRLHHAVFIDVLHKHRALETWVRIALTRVLAGTLDRNIELLSYSAEEKFKVLLKRSPQVLNLIPHKYLASYIGVDPTTFSKMLSTIKL
ncbi:MAG: Crp/Fnr family transcriptional regulator [Chitinophagaceae bacterium]|nr:Crp/Fnr family transcriptional regulator [Chitinophagaceae bacterium]